MMKTSKDYLELVSYEGSLTFDTIGDIIMQLKMVTGSNGVHLSVFKRMLSATIESLENVYKYQLLIQGMPDFAATLPLPRYSACKEEEYYILSVSNTILLSDRDSIAYRINHINTLDRKGLKNLYKETITDGQFSPSGGAGLGFIEMAKVSDQNIWFDFQPIDNNFVWFTLRISISDRHNKY